MPKRILVFSAHPDDLDFGCAGTVARLVKQGNKIIYCIISNGEKGIHKIKSSKQAIISIRKKEQKRAARIVGVKDVIFLNEKDGEVENTKALRRKLVSIIRKIKPDIVFSFDPANFLFDNFYRYHRDHRKAAEAVFDALYPASGSEAFFQDLNRKPHTIKEVWFFATHRPNLWINILGTIDKKIEALLSHRSQITDEKEFKKRIFSRAQEIGRKKKMRYAENFRKLTLVR
ncbi:MAG: PIG-L family deacetylase [Candidatus Nealsonbacteria bacterium]|nr:MAG: PIG-L family deacetylase [Candidatus Nealsonbacteria bacterium]